MSFLSKRVRTVVLASSFLLAASGLGLYHGGTMGGAPVKAEEAEEAKEEAAPRERHPHIRAAIKELREAKRELERADHDFDGHRTATVKAVEKAIEQLEKAVKHDRQQSTNSP